MGPPAHKTPTLKQHSEGPPSGRLPSVDAPSYFLHNLTVRIQMLFLLLILNLSVAAEEVRRLHLPTGSSADALSALRQLFPAQNYTFDRDGNCYVAGDSDDLDAVRFPSNFAAVWETEGLQTQLFPLTSGCHFDSQAKVIETVPVIQIIGYIQTLFPAVVFVPGREGRWHVAGDPESVESACRLAEHPPDPLPLPKSPSTGELPSIKVECIFGTSTKKAESQREFVLSNYEMPIYDNAFSQSVPVSFTVNKGAQAFPQQAMGSSVGRILFRF